MSGAIIVLNAGSSSLKFSIYEVAEEELRLESRGQIDGLGTAPRFKAKDSAGQSLVDRALDGPPKSLGHPEAFAHLAEWVRGQYTSKLKLLAIGHRVVHGGSDFIEPTLVDASILARLEKLIPLVPLHQPHNLAAIRAVSKLRPDLPQVACFDTAFHQGRAKVTERLGLPDELFHRGVRRWGFHGLSYDSIAKQFRRIAPEIAAGRVIVAHLGSGASMCAMKDGRSIDTTMGFSALDGLPMGTRCGSLDPGVLLFLLRDGWTPDRIEALLYKQSGLLGISGVSNDVRELLKSKAPLAAEALEYFVYRATREIGSLAASLGGLDALIFTAGIGENSPEIRARICRGAGWLGVEVNTEANSRSQRLISPPGRAPSVWAIPTDEEGVIAAQTLERLRSRDVPSSLPDARSADDGLSSHATR